MDRSDVFVSYRRADVEFTKQLYQSLKDTGRELWVDWEDIPPGVEGFTDEIQRGIEGADAFICVLSPSYLESNYCLLELREALKLKKRVIPVVLQKFEPERTPEGIGHINWIYFTPHAGQENAYEQSFPKVIEALEADYEHAREHTRLLLRAIDWDKNKRDVSYLMKGMEIDTAEHWQVSAINKTPAPTELQGEYVLISRKNQRQQQQRIMAMIGVLLVIAVIAAAFAVWQAGVATVAKNNALTQEAVAVTEQYKADVERATAEAAKIEADNQRTIAEAAKVDADNQRVIAVDEAQNARISSLAAQSQLIQSRQLAVLVALEAYNASKKKGEVSPAVETSLRKALLDFGGVPIHTHQSEASLATFSPDGHWLLSADVDGQVKISSADTSPVDLIQTGRLGDILLNNFNSPETKNIVFSQDSQWLAGIYTDDSFRRSIRVWSLRSAPSTYFELTLPNLNSDVSVTTIAFGSPKSKTYWFAAGFSDGSVYYWPPSDLKKTPTRLYHDPNDQMVTSLAFSPDGRWFVAAFGAHNAQAWNMASTNETPRVLDLTNIPIYDLTFSQGGKWLAGIVLASGNNGLEDFVKLWNMEAIENNPKPNIRKNGFNGNVLDIAFSPDERWLAVAKSGTSKNLQVWDLGKFSDIPIELPGHRDYVQTVDFSSDGRWLASGDWDGNVRLWSTADLPSGPTETMAQQFNGFDVTVRSLSFNKDSDQLVAAGDEQIRFWEFPVALTEPLKIKRADFDLLAKWLIVKTNDTSLLATPLDQAALKVAINTSHKNAISYRVSADERFLAVMSSKRIEIWDLDRPTAPHFTAERPDGQGQFMFESFDSTSHWFAYSVSNYSEIYAVNLQKLDRPALAITGNRKQFNLSDLYFAGPWLIAANDAEVLAWNPAVSTSEKQKLNTREGRPSISVVGDWLTVSESDGVHLWNVSDTKLEATLFKSGYLLTEKWLFEDIDDQAGNLWSLDINSPSRLKFKDITLTYASPSINLLVYKDAQNKYFVLDLSDTASQSIALGNLDGYYISSSPQGRWVIASPIPSDTNTASPMLLFDMQQDGAKRVLDYQINTNLTFSDDENWLYFSDSDGSWIFYNLQTQTQPDLLKDHRSAYRFKFSPDGHWLFAMLSENSGASSLLVDLNGSGNSYLLRGHTDYLSDALFLPDNKLVTTSFDGTARIWDLNNLTADPIALKHDDVVNSPMLSADGRWLMTLTDTGRLYVWRMDFDAVHDLACSLIGRNLTQDEWRKYMGDEPYRKTCTQWPEDAEVTLTSKP